MEFESPTRLPRALGALGHEGLWNASGNAPGPDSDDLGHLESLWRLPGVELRFHDVHLYNAIYRFDDQMIVTPYLVGAHGYQHPALHLRRLGPYGIFASFADQLETLWARAAPADARAAIGEG